MVRISTGVLGLMFLCTIAAQADTVTFTGALKTGGVDDPNAVFQSTFTLTTSSDVLIETYSYGGLNDQMGNVIDPGGGFLPEIVISSSGVGSQLLADSAVNIGLPSIPPVSACPPANVDAAQFCGDAAVEILGLSSGTYTFDIINITGNQATVDAAGNLSGFSGQGSFFGPSGFLDSHLAGNVIVTPEISSVPEPGTGLLLGSSLLALISRKLWRRTS
jgi:hypothetical protein